MAKKHTKILRFAADSREITGAVKWYHAGLSKPLLAHVMAHILGVRTSAIKKIDPCDVYYLAGQTADGEWHWVVRQIEYSLTPSLHACDWRCQRAKGRSCECSCAGANHGAGGETRFRAEACDAITERTAQ